MRDALQNKTLLKIVKPGLRPAGGRLNSDYFSYLKTNNLMDLYYDTISMFRHGTDASLAKYLYTHSTNGVSEDYGEKGWRKLCNSKGYHYAHTDSIIGKFSKEIGHIIGEDATFLDYGVGNETGTRKTLALMSGFRNPAGYVALDYNKNFAMNAVNLISKNYPSIYTQFVPGDFFQWQPDFIITKPVALFFGGTITNINEDRNTRKQTNAISRLEYLRRMLGENAYLILSQDTAPLTKDLAIQYDTDVCGNWFLSIFEDIKSKLLAEFNPKDFTHVGEIRDAEHCYAHCARSLANQTIQIGPEEILIKEGEVFDLARSYKYSLDQFQSILDDAGWDTLKTFSDPNKIAFHVCKSR